MRLRAAQKLFLSYLLLIALLVVALSAGAESLLRRTLLAILQTGDAQWLEGASLDSRRIASVKSPSANSWVTAASTTPGRDPASAPGNGRFEPGRSHGNLIVDHQPASGHGRRARRTARKSVGRRRHVAPRR